jgi:hypothetical protein
MTEDWEKAIAQVVKAINQKRRQWGIKINKWELTGRRLGMVTKTNLYGIHYPVEILTFTFHAEVNRTAFEAPINIFLNAGRALGLNVDYIQFGMNYINLGLSVENAPIPIAAFLLGRYLKSIFPSPAPQRSLGIYPDKACVLMHWNGWKPADGEPLLKVKAIVTTQTHGVVITYKGDYTIETKVREAPKIIKTVVALQII